MPAFAAITLRYQEREVLVGPLAREADPNLLELCREHVERMTPPIGWRVCNQRAEHPAAVS